MLDKPSGRVSRPATALLTMLVALGAAASALLAQQSGTNSQAGRNNGNQGRQVSLEDQLRVGLKAFTKADFAFLESVVTKVQAGVLPRRLVDSTFLWARRRATWHRGPRRLRPMVYFRPALILRARPLGVNL